MNEWKPMSANPFPWDHKDVILAVFEKSDPMNREVLRCYCAEHGAYFPVGGSMLSVSELGWVPYAWREDDTPERNDEAFPPMWTDYLTQKS